MAVRLVVAVAADGERGVLRERSQQIEQPRGGRPLHLGAVAPHERVPRARTGAAARQGDQRLGWRQLRHPHIVEIARRILRLRHTARRPAHRPQTQAFARCTWRAELNDADRHGLTSPPAAGALPGRRLFSGQRLLPGGRLLRRPALPGRRGALAGRMLRQLLAAGFAVPFFERLRRDLALDEELRELAPLRLTLEWHGDETCYR